MLVGVVGSEEDDSIPVILGGDIENCHPRFEDALEGVELARLEVLGKLLLEELESQEGEDEDDEEHEDEEVDEGGHGFLGDDCHLDCELVVLNHSVEEDGFEGLHQREVQLHRV